MQLFAEKGDLSNKKRPKRDPGLPKRDPVGSSGGGSGEKGVGRREWGGGSGEEEVRRREEADRGEGEGIR